MLTKEAFNKVYAYGIANAKDFRGVSDQMVAQYVTSITGQVPLSDVARATISEVSSIDMAVGAKLMRNKYILIGVLIGAVGVVATVMTISVIRVIKKKRGNAHD
jgi:hypothetical protein